MHRRFFIPSLIASPLLASASSDFEEDAIWNAWLTWFGNQPGAPTMSELLRQYRATLSDHGVASAEIDRRLALIQNRIGANPDEWSKIAYNKLYASGSTRFNQQPNAFLVRMVENRRPGKALDYGMGSGRNSIYLARHGWEVTGFDLADEGISAARKTAERLGVRLNAVVANARTFDWGDSRWDLIVATYEDELGFADRIVNALRPGGLLVIEDYLWDVAERKRERPSGAVGPNELLDKYRKLRILHYEDVADLGDFGARQKTRLVRLAAEKP